MQGGHPALVPVVPVPLLSPPLLVLWAAIGAPSRHKEYTGAEGGCRLAAAVVLVAKIG
jgi:hypothetical protein